MTTDTARPPLTEEELRKVRKRFAGSHQFSPDRQLIVRLVDEVRRLHRERRENWRALTSKRAESEIADDDWKGWFEEACRQSAEWEALHDARVVELRGLADRVTPEMLEEVEQAGKAGSVWNLGAVYALLRDLKAAADG